METAKKRATRNQTIMVSEEEAKILNQSILWTAKRLQMVQKDSSIQGYTNGVFWERNSLNGQRGEK